MSRWLTPARVRALVHVCIAVVLVGVVGGILALAISIYRTPLAPQSSTPVATGPAPVQVAAPAVRTAAPAGAPATAAAVDLGWVARVSAATGISPAAVRAYGVATLRLGEEQPDCRIGWTTLAGIGYVESHNGTLGGRTVLADGRSSRPILGPALDGAGAFAAIRADATATALHGDTEWDHAVGPMQFLSSTWERWGGDADGDGRADPFDLDDAALGAGRYLCADGGDLSTGPGWTAAIYSYNHSQAYVNSVYTAAESYATAGG